MLRLGPNKPGFMGLYQPLLDALKLFTKQIITPYQANKFIYNSAPHLSLIISLFIWVCLPVLYSSLHLNYSLLLFFCLTSLLVFPVLLSGWSSNSKYRLIGSLRSVAQSISYESVFRTLVVLFILIVSSYSIRSFFYSSSLIYLFLFLVWFICTLAETHRAPFDFRESESELVRGFNTEYGRAYFSFIFLSEYAILLLSCFLFPIIFFSWVANFSVLSLSLFAIFFSFLFIWVRITFCRFRYDILIMMSWKILLPVALNIFIIFIFLFI